MILPRFQLLAACVVLALPSLPARVVAETPAHSPLYARAEPAGESAAPGAGNQLALMSGGYDALLLRVHLIRHARESIDVQTFIWSNDACGRLLIHELLEAARRGVRVRIIADHLFSDQDPDVVAFLATADPRFEVRHYRPATSRMKPSLLRTLLAGAVSFRSVNQRMHSKVMVFDGKLLLTGGRNIENTYYDHSTALNYRDRDVLATGPVVAAAASQFEQFWGYRYTVPSRKLIDVDRAIRAGSFRRFERREDFDFEGHFDELHREADDEALIAERLASRLKPVRRAVFLYDVPGKPRRASINAAAVTRELQQALERARHSVVIQTPYLVLSDPAKRLIRSLHQRSPGVQIRISTNSFASTDNLFAYSANYRMRSEYVQDLQLRIHEYKPRPANMEEIFPRHGLMARHAVPPGNETPHRPFLSLHAKSLVVDDAVAFVGSFNLDPRSADLNTEVGILVEDEAFARALQEEIERDMAPANSWVIADRNLPLGLEVVNGLVDGLLSITPIDLWPIQNTSSFELRPGAVPVPPGHPAFHECHRDVGSFPGTDGLLSQKEILTRLFKAVGSPLTPIL